MGIINDSGGPIWYATEAEFQRDKDKLLEAVILHVRDPERFPDCPRLSLTEVAILMAKDKDDIKSKMKWCSVEAEILTKLRQKLATRLGIKSVSDVYFNGGPQTTGRYDVPYDSPQKS